MFLKSMKVKEFLLFAVFWFMTQMSFGQLVINEIMASNSNSVPDNTGKFSDWIEIYNSSSVERYIHYLA